MFVALNIFYGATILLAKPSWKIIMPCAPWVGDWWEQLAAAPKKTKLVLRN